MRKAVESVESWMRHQRRNRDHINVAIGLHDVASTIATAIDHAAEECGLELPGNVVCYFANGEVPLLTIDLPSAITAEQSSRFLRTLLHKLGIARAAKSPFEDGIRAEFNCGGINVRIDNYLGPTCRIVEEPITIPAQPEYTRIRRRVVCDGEEE